MNGNARLGTLKIDDRKYRLQSTVERICRDVLREPYFRSQHPEVIASEISQRVAREMEH